MPTPINISASRGASILGLSKWSTPLNVWLQIMESREPGFCEKNKYELPEFEYNAPMRWGHAFESAIIELAEGEQGEVIIEREKLYGYGNPLNTFITCHIDGLYSTQKLHEGKTTTIFSYRDEWGEPGTDKVPVEYQIQCQHQMICTGAEKVILSVLVFPRRVDDWEEMGITSDYEKFNYEKLIPKNKLVKLNDDKSRWHNSIDPYNWAIILDEMGYFHQYEIPANPELQKLMIEHYTEFWEVNVVGGMMPEPRTYDDIKAICREPVGTIIATEEIERFMSEYKNIKSEISTTGALAKRADQIKVTVLDFMRTNGADAVDDDSADKFILRDRTGAKIGSYGKNKNGGLIFR